MSILLNLNAPYRTKVRNGSQHTGHHTSTGDVVTHMSFTFDQQQILILRQGNKEHPFSLYVIRALSRRYLCNKKA